jgi:hypothetical protein
MPNHSTDQIPPRKDNWSLSQEGYEQATRLDYFGQPYQSWQPVKKDLGKAWESFREQFRSQEQRKPGHNSFNPPLDKIEWKEVNP